MKAGRKVPTQSRVSKRAAGASARQRTQLRIAAARSLGNDGDAHAEIDVLPEQEVQPAKVVQFTAAAR